MAKSKGLTIAVKIPINWESMTDRKKQRLRQIVGRDTRVICAYLGIIQQYEKELLVGKNKQRINECKLNELTLTALQVISHKKQRTKVPHDFKEHFPRISSTEFTECRKTATASYEGYLALRNKGVKVARPNKSTVGRRIPRWIFIPYRATLLEHKTGIARWWLDVRDSLDSVPNGKRHHDRLLVPLKMSPFHLNQIQRGVPKALQIFRDSGGKWWISVAVRLEEVEAPTSSDFPMAVLGIDLGIKKSACTTLLTEERVSETRYFSQREKVEIMEKLDTAVANLQHHIDTSRNQGEEPYGLLEKLKSIRKKRNRVSKEYDRILVKQLVNYISALSERYHLYVALGRVSGIRNIARKGNKMSRHMRGMVHRWAYARVSDMLEHGLSQLGWETQKKGRRFLRIPEAWTSIICWKCGKKGYRPRQSLFVCSCGFRTNADRNGSLNIARRLIKLIPSLKNETRLGRWVVPEKQLAPKTGRTISKRKPALSCKDGASHLGKSAVVHTVQLDLFSLGDETEECDNDYTVAKTVERLSDHVRDADMICQEKEARSDGGIASR